MTSCLETTSCPDDKRIYNIRCNFSIRHNNYLCNKVNTCIDTTGEYNCCAYYIADCIVLESSLPRPTFQPTQDISNVMCNNQICNTQYDIDQCYWYESINTNIL